MTARRRGWLAGCAVVVTVVLLLTGAILLRLAHRTGHSAPIGTPADLLVSFPLDRRPVPGWHLSTTDIGLPPGTAAGTLFAENGDDAYLATDCGAACPEPPVSWVYGIDTSTGSGLFAPVRLTGSVPRCNRNGPGTAVCLTATDGALGDHRVVSVIDLDHGAVTFTGPTDLTFTHSSWYRGGPPTLSSVGDYRVISTDDGVYGVGPRAERTWRLPGGGQVLLPEGPNVTNTPAPTLAVRAPSAADPRFRVFSVVDGTDLTPTPPRETTLKRAMVYTGGFAYQYEQGASAGVLFYDTAGRLIRRQPAEHYPVLVDNPAIPIVLDAPVFHVYTAAGRPLATIPADDAYSQSPLFEAVGTKLYAWLNYNGGEHWKQWDLLTGEPGISCGFHLSGYVASDGAVVLAEDEYGMWAATEMSTCRTMWKLPATDNRIRRVGRGLIRIGFHDITSLRPPE